jgi:PAS domain S-box-containing protein
MNILVIDDGAAIRKLLRKALELAGHHIHEAADGVEALAILEREPVDAIISDILMPRMDGYRLCQELRRKERFRTLPFIFHTATYTTPSDEKLSLDLGADAFLHKPASITTIMEVLARVTSRPRAVRAAEAMSGAETLEADVLRQYSDRLVAKLEKRNLELTEAEAKFRILVEQSITGIYIIQGDRFVYVNPRMVEILNRSTEELISKSLLEFIHPADRALAAENIRKRLSGEVPSIRYQLRMLHQSGAVVHVEVHGGRAEYRGQPSVIGTLLDITERRQAEEHIQAALREKEVLLKEIHHRVKNNLQVVSSLLRLQSRGMRSPETVAAFEESCARVHSMALVHEKLYQSQSLSELDFATYAESLTDSLLHAYGTDPAIVRVRLDMEPVRLDINQAIPCALILNELVANALKYAFPGGRHGEIRLRLRAEAGDAICLMVGDNGVGMPVNLDPLNVHTLGLQLVTTLVSQLRATLEVRRTHGTGYAITFIAAKPDNASTSSPS